MKYKNIFEIIFIIATFFFMNYLNVLNMTPYLLLFLVIILYKFTKNFKNNKNITIFSLIFSLIFTVGNLNLDKYHLNEWLILTIEFIGWYFFLRRLFFLLEKNYHKINGTSNNQPISKKKFIIISTIVGFILYLPYLLKLYPGVMSFDSYEQLSQVVGNLSYSNHHPIFHTFIIKIFYEIGTFLSGNSNIGVLLYTLFQMICAAYTFSWVTYTLYHNNVSKYLVIFLWLFFFVTPYNAIYAITMWKDILFSYVTLFITVFLWNHYHNNEEWTNQNKIVFTILSILVCLLRSNGFYAYIAFIIFFFLLYKKEFQKVFLEIIIVLVITITFKYPLLSVLKVKQPDFVESISIPLQQVAYVIRKDGKINEQEKELISKISDYDLIKNDQKHFHISNPVKNNIREHDTEHFLENNKLKYLKLWFNLGVKNLKYYKDAYVLQTSGYYYHNYGKYWIYLYDLTNDGYAGKMNIERKTFLPNFISKYIDIKLKINDFIYYHFGSLAICLYLVLISLFITITKKEKTISYIIPLSIVMTLLIATPVACEFRYFYPIFLLGPTFLIISFMRGDKIEK